MTFPEAAQTTMSRRDDGNANSVRRPRRRWFAFLGSRINRLLSGLSAEHICSPPGDRQNWQPVAPSARRSSLTSHYDCPECSLRWSSR